MPDTDVPVVTSTTPAEAMPVTSMEAMTAPERKAYLETGTIPTREAKPSDAAPGQDADESGTASEAVGKEQKQDPKPENRAERRIRETLAENKRLVARIEALERGAAAEPAKPKETPTAAANSKAPKLKDFQGPGHTSDEWTDLWEEAKDAYYEAQRRESVREAIKEEREAAATADREAKAKKDNDKLVDTFAKRAKEFIKTLTEDHFDEHLTDVSKFISKPYPYLDAAISESDVGPQLVNYFGEHFEELEKLAAMTPTAALRELGRLEISEKITGPAPKNRTAAKKLGSDVRGTGTTFDEDAELIEAAANNDWKTYDRIRRKQEAAERTR